MERLNKEERTRIYTSLFNDARPDRYYYIMVVLSCTVATYGLLSNSTAVVIGAMLIAPLMGPLLGGALAIASNSKEIMKRSFKAETVGSLLAVGLAMFLTIILPSAELTPEIMARTAPTLLDLVIALASGAAGTYAICKKPNAAIMPGVAISTALMPPLCVIGIGLAAREFSVMTGAALQFLANLIAINVAAIAVFKLAGIQSRTEHNNENEFEPFMKLKNPILYPILLLIFISVPLAFLMYKTYNHAATDKIIKNSLAESLKVIAPRPTLISSDFKEQVDRYEINVTFQTAKIMSPENIRQMENYLELNLGKPVDLRSDVVLVQKVDGRKDVNYFNELLPKNDTTEVITNTTTPEEAIQGAVLEKISLFPDVKLKDYLFEYRNGSGTYSVTVVLEGSLGDGDNDKLSKSIQGVLEERLKRRVDLNIQISANNDQLPAPPP